MSTRPQKIGRYRIVETLGRGAMGVVYKAHDPDIDRIVAIKLVRADLLSGESRAHYLARFQNEARMAGRCIHPNIVAIHDMASHDGNPFLVLEFVDGVDLGRAHPRGAQMQLAQVLRIGEQVLEALNYAHGFGVVHRDIKPANILLTGADGLKVADFGISRALSAEATMSSVLVGTPCYMSPEQCLGRGVDARSDLFSVGCVLYELLTGARAFSADNYVATIHRLINEAPEPLEELRAQLPSSMVALVERALAKSPEARFGSAAEMRAALVGISPRPGATGLLSGRVESPAADEDRTIIKLAQAPAGVERFTPDLPVRALPDGSLPPSSSPTLQAIERKLAYHVGPMARHHLRRAISEAVSVEDFCNRLADNLSASVHRADFINHIMAMLAKDTSNASGATEIKSTANGPAPADVARVEHAFKDVMGPIAPRLIRQMLRDNVDLECLLEQCLAHISLERERKRFISLAAPDYRGRPRG